jgi:2-dehydro-3-deoxyphosphogluconate aldolase/(4S)-4-hydroxy-2-oxoglutarate aldolase
VAETHVVAVMRGIGSDRCIDVAAAADDGGIRVFEVTMESPNADVTISALASQGYVVGAGTVLSVDDARTAVDSGAQFLVSPHTDPNIADWAVDHGQPIIPGAFTATEVVAAWNLGVSAVKLFPASVCGPDLVMAISAPLGRIPLMVTGGIDATNIGAYLSAGAFAAGVGGWLTGLEDLETIRNRAQMLVDATRAVNV